MFMVMLICTQRRALVADAVHLLLHLFAIRAILATLAKRALLHVIRAIRAVTTHAVAIPAVCAMTGAHFTTSCIPSFMPGTLGT